MTRLMRAHATAWCVPPTGLAAYGWATGEFWLVALVVISLPGICISASRSTRWLEKHQARRQARRVWRGPSGTLWVLVALLVLLPILAQAQEIAGLADVLAGANSISTLPAAKPGVIPPNSFEIFHPLFVAVTQGLTDTVQQSAGVVLGWVHELLVPVCSLGVIFMAFVEAAGFGGYMFWLVRYLVRAGVILTLVDTAADYDSFIVAPILSTANGMIAQLAGVGDPGALAHVFDAIMAHVSASVVGMVRALMWSSPLGALESIPVAFIAMICWLLAFGGVGISFAVFTVAFFTLSLLLAVGPLFVFLAMAGPLRSWTQGYCNAIASQLLTMMLVGVSMRLLSAAINQMIDLVMNAPDDINIWTQVGHVIALPVVIGFASVASLCSRSISVGVVSGVYSTLQPYASAVSGMIRAGQGMFGGGGHGGGAPSPSHSTPSMAIPHAAPGRTAP